MTWGSQLSFSEPREGGSLEDQRAAKSNTGRMFTENPFCSLATGNNPQFWLKNAPDTARIKRGPGQKKKKKVPVSQSNSISCIFPGVEEQAILSDETQMPFFVF